MSITCRPSIHLPTWLLSLLGAVFLGIGLIIAPVMVFKIALDDGIEDYTNIWASVAIELSNLPLVAWPAIAVLFWIPNAARSLHESLSQAQDKGRNNQHPSKTVSSLPPTSKRHLIISAVFAGIAVAPSTWSLRNDDLNEWFEAAGAVGWIPFMIFIWIITALAILAALRLSAVVGWLISNCKDGLNVSPLDPDNAGGFLFLGQFLTKATAIAVIAGFWFVSKLVVIFYFNNDGEFSSIDAGFIGMALLFSSFYLFLVWWLIVRPTKHIRRGMTVERNSKLGELSLLFDTESGKPSNDANERYEPLSKIVENHTQVKRTYPLMPFPTSRIGAVPSGTISPPAVGVASIMFQSFTGISIASI